MVPSPDAPVAASTARALGRAALRLGGGLALILAMLMLVAGDVGWWNAWLLVACFLVPMAPTGLWLARVDPEFLEKRLRTNEREPAQRVVMAIAVPLYVALFLVPAFGHRFGWASLPVAWVWVGAALVLLGYGLFVRVMAVNRFASRVVEVQEGQRVIDTGPYAVVRHPMYTGAVVLSLGVALVLGSPWALLPAALMAVPMGMRAVAEEALLVRELEGYGAYRSRVKWRLVPFVW